MVEVRPAAILKFVREEYEARKRDHQNYWTWRKNRNEARSETEAKFGFDTKNASHLIRLMRQAYEVLTEGVVRVRRHDAEELLAIRRGEWSYERILAEAEAIDARLEEAEAKSSLPTSIDLRLIGDIVIEMYEATWAARVGRKQVALAPRI